MRRDSLHHVITKRSNQTLGRTVITSGTALLTALALFSSARGAPTASPSPWWSDHHRHLLSIFIAAAIVSFWRGNAPTRAGAHAPAASAR
jgi:hypothetical protein